MAKYNIQIKKSAAKDIKKLPAKDLKKILIRIEDLASNPRPHDCKKLSNEEKYRIRVGDYRILYNIEDDVVIIFVVQVAHRKDAYRKK